LLRGRYVLLLRAILDLQHVIGQNLSGLGLPWRLLLLPF
tara:strand:- start:991 stop:1107 length:117 start_codon:yes stop_codon:yes gene_type:complete